MPELETQLPPFRSDAPCWYNNGVWGELGCAVPQAGRYLHTMNSKIHEIVNLAGRQLFHVFWHYDDRKFDRPPGRDVMEEIHQLVIVSRKRLSDLAIAPNEKRLMATHAKPAPQMFIVYPIPFYGNLGCRQTFLRDAAELSMLMITEAMQHMDNELAHDITTSFYEAVAPYLQRILVTMATRYFGYTREEASVPTFAIPAEKFKSYSPMDYAVSVEGTAQRPPVAATPTEEDLQPINGLPVNEVVPYCGPWPSTVLQYSPGGVWSPQGSPSQSSDAAKQATVSGAFPSKE
jgi:hypothetical protein